MATKRIDTDKNNHKRTLMELTFTADRDCYAVCPKCEGYVGLTDEQAAIGRAQCFGDVILIGWPGNPSS